MLVKKSIDIKDSLHYNVFNLFNEISKWGLSTNELKVIASLYDKDFKLSKEISNIDIRMNVLFSKDVKTEIMNKHKLSYNTLNNMLSILRKKGFITNNTIDESYLLNLDKESFNFNILFVNARKD